MELKLTIMEAVTLRKFLTDQRAIESTALNLMQIHILQQLARDVTVLLDSEEVSPYHIFVNAVHKMSVHKLEDLEEYANHNVSYSKVVIFYHDQLVFEYIVEDGRVTTYLVQTEGHGVEITG